MVRDDEVDAQVPRAPGRVGADWMGAIAQEFGLGLKQRGIDLKSLDKDMRGRVSIELMDDLMREVGRVIPVLPVSLVSHALLACDGPISTLELKARVQALIDELQARDAKVYIPRSDREYSIEVGLRMLTLRRLIADQDGMLTVSPRERHLLQYYSNAIAHLF